MHLHRLAILLPSLLFTPNSAIALPTLATDLAPRSQFCDNAPSTIAGTQVSIPFHSFPSHPIPQTPQTTTPQANPPPLRPHSLLTRHLLPHPRTHPRTYLWCAPQTRTHILLTLTSLLPLPLPAPANPISALLTQAARAISTHIRLHGDGPLPGGGYDWMAESVDLVVWNADNHQTTWGVLGAAVGAVAECMQVNGWGVGRFGIWDGGREVGGGEVG